MDYLTNSMVQCRIHNGSPIVPILSRIKPSPHYNIYFFKTHSNIVLPFTLRSLSCCCRVKIWKALLPPSILATRPVHQSSRLNHPDCILDQDYVLLIRISLSSILILSSYLRLGLPESLFSIGLTN